MLILHAQSDIANSPLGDRRVLAGRNLRECTEEEDAPTASATPPSTRPRASTPKPSFSSASRPIKDLASDYDHYSWFMAVSRARQLLAIVE